jgi:Putative Actinobacterial Holin-X, holin superfamily III
MTPAEEELRTAPNDWEATAPADLAIGELVGRLSDDTVRLVRGEIHLAQAEMSQKAKAACAGVAMFGGAGICGLYGFGCADRRRRRPVHGGCRVRRHAHRRCLPVRRSWRRWPRGKEKVRKSRAAV